MIAAFSVGIPLTLQSIGVGGFRKRHIDKGEFSQIRRHYLNPRRRDTKAVYLRYLFVYSVPLSRRLTLILYTIMHYVEEILHHLIRTCDYC